MINKLGMILKVDKIEVAARKNIWIKLLWLWKKPT